MPRWAAARCHCWAWMTQPWRSTSPPIVATPSRSAGGGGGMVAHTGGTAVFWGWGGGGGGWGGGGGGAFGDRVGVADVVGLGGGCVGQTGTADAISDGAACVSRFFPVTLADDNPIRGRTGISVFATRIVRGVDASRPTPPRMVSRLALAGIRSRSLLVDITNYVMLEIGQPVHGYDLDALRGGITVRRARAGDTLTTLDEKERALHPEDLIITDDRGPIGLAGVMGGADTELRDSTRNVLIEAAHFDPVSIARTARRHRGPSEASRRFERGVDPEIAEAATARVAHLMVKYAGGVAEPGTVVRGASGAEVVGAAGGGNDPVAGAGSSAGVARVIDLPADYIANRTGADYSTGEIVGTLSQIGATVTETASGFRVTPPSWRPDLTGCAELAEEVARLTGYDRIPSVLPVAPPGRGLPRAQRLRRQAAGALAPARSPPTPTLPLPRPPLPSPRCARAAAACHPFASQPRSTRPRGCCVARCCRGSSLPRDGTGRVGSRISRSLSRALFSCPPLAVSTARQPCPRVSTCLPPPNWPRCRRASHRNHATSRCCLPAG